MLPKTNPELKSDNYPFLVPILSFNPKFQKIVRKCTNAKRSRARARERRRTSAIAAELLLPFYYFFGKLEVEYRTRGFFIFHFFEFLEIFGLRAVFPLVYCGKKKKKKKKKHKVGTSGGLFFFFFFF
jgi:hypothetical protein